MYCGFFLNSASLQTSVTNTEIQNITIDYLFQNKLSYSSQYEEKTLFSYFTKGISGNQKPELKAALATWQFLSIDRLAEIDSTRMQMIKQLKG